MKLSVDNPVVQWGSLHMLIQKKERGGKSTNGKGENADALE